MLLSVDRLGVEIGGRALLSEVSFTLNGGDRLAVLGQSGSGKSVLAAALVDALPSRAVRSGAVTLGDGEAPAKQLGKRVAYVSDLSGAMFDPLRPIGSQLGPDAPAVVTSAELDAGLTGQYPATVPGSQLRLLAIAAALAGKPELLIADDPTADLDLLTQARVMTLIRTACVERGMTLVLVTHDLKLAAELCTRAVVLAAGRSVESGSKQDIFGRPRHELTRRLMTAGRARAKTLMRAPIGGPLLELRRVGLSVARPKVSLARKPPPLEVLQDVSLSVRQGEAVAVTGPRGSGKSTLLRIVAGLTKATSGEIELDHQVYHGTDIPVPLRREIGMVFSDPAASFNPRLAVGESVAEPLRLESLKPMDELGDRIVEVVRAVGFAPEAMVRPPSDFTPGQLQRLALARALVTRPRLIVLDEPFKHLDVVARGDLLAMLMRLRADFGLTLLFAATDFETLKLLADRVHVLDQGRIVETGTPAVLLEKPQHALTQQLVAAQLPDVSIVPVF